MFPRQAQNDKLIDLLANRKDENTDFKTIYMDRSHQRSLILEA